MATEIYIVSGFLGVGKTTFIEKLIREFFHGKKVVLIENDFGEISVDSALLKAGGVEVKEMNAGCICCSLSGDFVKAVLDVLKRFSPDIIVIEPSGVGKLSDVIRVCSDPRILPFAKIYSKITVADVKRSHKYFENFGEFFKDQIQHADIILLSRTESFPEEISDTCALISKLNANAAILSTPWGAISSAEILSLPKGESPDARCGHLHEGECHDHKAHKHCNHDHAAEDIFDTVTIRTNRLFTDEALRACVNQLEQNLFGTVLRAKGIVRGVSGYVNLQYVPGELHMTSCDAPGGMVCVIGENLNPATLTALFSGE